MAPTGFHGLLGLFLAGRIDRKQKYLRIGFVFGSVFPDLDLMGSVLFYIVSHNRDLAIGFHRSLTHSLFLIGVLILLIFILKVYPNNRLLNHSIFIVGLTCGIFLHTLIDFFYFDGVSLLWPFQDFGERLYFFDFTYEDFPTAYNSLIAKLIGTFDGGFESIYFFIMANIAIKLQTDKEKKIHIFSKSFEINSWPKLLKQISYLTAITTVIFIILAFLSINWTFLDRDSFIILLYIPFTPIYLLSGLLPLFLTETISKY